MKLQELKSNTKETFVAGENVTVVINSWGNHEGCNIMVNGEDDLSVRMAGALRWEDVDALIVALSAARSV